MPVYHQIGCAIIPLASLSFYILMATLESRKKPLRPCGGSYNEETPLLHCPITGMCGENNAVLQVCPSPLLGPGVVF